MSDEKLMTLWMAWLYLNWASAEEKTGKRRPSWLISVMYLSSALLFILFFTL